MNYCIDIGVAGFRVDAGKHMWPGDLEVIYGQLHDLNTVWFKRGARPFVFQEVIDYGGEAIKANDYTHLGRVTELKYGSQLTKAFHGDNHENQLMQYSDFGENWGFVADKHAIVCIDNHDNQRGHGGGGNVITHGNPSAYKKANAFMLAWPYGITRIMSSFYFRTGDDSPPCDEDGTIQSPTFLEDGACAVASGWVCEHRWRQIRNMVGFRNAAAEQAVANWWDNNGNQVAYGRGNRAFIVINNDAELHLDEVLQTGLPEGVYCDVIHGDVETNGGSCTGPDVYVDANGYAKFSISPGEDAMSAIHVNARIKKAKDKASAETFNINRLVRLTLALLLHWARYAWRKRKKGQPK